MTATLRDRSWRAGGELPMMPPMPPAPLAIDAVRSARVRKLSDQLKPSEPIAEN